jgi:hypothetical protein
MVSLTVAASLAERVKPLVVISYRHDSACEQDMEWQAMSWER